MTVVGTVAVLAMSDGFAVACPAGTVYGVVTGSNDGLLEVRLIAAPPAEADLERVMVKSAVPPLEIVDGLIVNLAMTGNALKLLRKLPTSSDPRPVTSS